MGRFKRNDKKESDKRPKIDEADLSRNIFTPMIYHGNNDSEFTEVAANVDRDVVVERIQTRVNLDGMWCIDNDLVGPKPAGPAKMERMMAFASDRKNIEQAIEHAANDGATVDFICRDVANASKFAANAPGRN